MSKTPDWLHKQALQNIANANLKITIWPNEKVEIEPADKNHQPVDKPEPVSFV